MIKQRPTRINSHTGILEYIPESVKPVVPFSNYVSADDVLNRIRMGSTGIAPATMSQEAINQVNAQQKAVEDAARLAATIKAQAEAAQIAKDIAAEKILQLQREADAQRMQDQANAALRAKIAAEEIEKQRLANIADAQRIVDENAKAQELERIRLQALADQKAIDDAHAQEVEQIRLQKIADQKRIDDEYQAQLVLARIASGQVAQQQIEQEMQAHQTAVQNQQVVEAQREAIAAASEAGIATVDPLQDAPKVYQDIVKANQDIQSTIVEDENKQRLALNLAKQKPIITNESVIKNISWLDQLVNYIYKQIYS
jgi:hypothetical protein